MRGVPISADVRDAISADLRQIASRHMIALSTIAKLATAEVKAIARVNSIKSGNVEA